MASSSTPIRLAIIGTGLIVTGKHWPALATLTPDFQVVALANRTPAKAEALAESIQAATGQRPSVYADHSAMLRRESLDAVSIALPPVSNPEVIRAALTAGLHVIAEKPPAVTLAEGRDMLGWSEVYGRVLMIAENYRYIASFQRAARLVAEGAIGRPVSAHWTLYKYMAPDNPYAATAWRREPLHPGGFLSDGGVHHMAVMRTILGEARDIRAHAASYRSDLDPLDTLAAVMTWSSGAIGTYQVTYAVPGPDSPLQITGTEGTVRATQTWVELYPASGDVQCWDEISPQDGLAAMYRDFAQAIRTGRPPLATPAQSLADLEMIVDMLRAAGHPVPT